MLKIVALTQSGCNQLQIKMFEWQCSIDSGRVANVKRQQNMELIRQT